MTAQTKQGPPVMTAVAAAKLIAAGLTEYLGLDEPVKARDKDEALTYGWCPADAQVPFEGHYYWAPDFVAHRLGDKMAALHAEITAHGVLCEPYSGWLLSLYEDG